MTDKMETDFPANYDEPTEEMKLYELADHAQLDRMLKEAVGLSHEWVRDYAREKLGIKDATSLPQHQLILHIQKVATASQIRELLAHFEPIKPMFGAAEADSD